MLVSELARVRGSDFEAVNASLWSEGEHNRFRGDFVCEAQLLSGHSLQAFNDEAG
jgi:hypothetical protein